MLASETCDDAPESAASQDGDEAAFGSDPLDPLSEVDLPAAGPAALTFAAVRRRKD